MQEGEWAAGVESVFRRANEQIGELARDVAAPDGDPSALTPFLCECARRECRMILRIPLDRYEEVRSQRGRFVVAEGHEGPAASERVVHNSDGFVVVEKVGAALREVEEEASGGE